MAVSTTWFKESPDLFVLRSDLAPGYTFTVRRVRVQQYSGGKCWLRWRFVIEENETGHKWTTSKARNSEDSCKREVSMLLRKPLDERFHKLDRLYEEEEETPIPQREAKVIFGYGGITKQEREDEEVQPIDERRGVAAVAGGGGQDGFPNRRVHPQGATHGPRR